MTAPRRPRADALIRLLSWRGDTADNFAHFATDIAEAMRQLAGESNRHRPGPSTRVEPPMVSSMRPRMTRPPSSPRCASISSPVLAPGA